MTLMLASVTGPAEAETAIVGGADIIDLKDPANGVLGAVALPIVRATVAAVAGRRPVSAVTGDAPMDPDRIVAAAEDMAAAGLDYLKQGVFTGRELERSIQALAPLTERVRLVAVLFADRAPDLRLLPALARAGFHGAMLDTADKSHGRLLDHIDLPQLRRFVAECDRLGLVSGLAGALEAPDIPRLLVLHPSVLGFRGALCGDAGRTGPIQLTAVQEIRELIPRETTADAERTLDYRLLAARGYAHDPARDPTATDTVFVHDFVLPVRIGAYASERASPQPVRFNVEAAVARGSWVSRAGDTGAAARWEAGMRDVLSYDLIRDGIRMLADAGHVGLVETLAERVAAMVLAHPRVVTVTVKVEKLEAGPGIVGVALERTRETVNASAQQMVGQMLPTASDRHSRDARS
jgi:dihydroneopterin aldolase